MGVNKNSSIVTDNLTLYYDFYNQEKSFKGEPIANQFAIPTPDSSNNVYFSVNGTGVFKRIFSGDYGGYRIKSSDIIYKYDLGAGGCHYHGNDVTIPSGQYATFSFDYFVSPDAQNYPTDGYLANFENLGSGISVGQGVLNNLKGVWQSIQFTGGPAYATSGLRMLLYPGGCSGSYLASSGYILMKNPQVTFTSYKVPFIAGTRYANNGLIDLSNNRNTSTLNVTYPSGANQYSYNILNSYTGAVITDSSSILDNDTHSIFFMIRFNTTSSYGSNGYSGSWDKIFSFNAGGSDRSPGIWRFPSSRYIHWRYDPGNTGCDFGKNSSNQDFDIDTWYYIGVTKNGGNTKMYVNGIQVGTGSVSNPKTAGSTAVQLFEYYPNSLASMGSLQIYNKVLTETEVLKNFSAIRSRYNI